jgi:glycerol-3-phosphate acyltransferase PlsY
LTIEQLKILLWLTPLAYLAGSVNFSILLFKLTGKGDPRRSFSGNAGTANVVRQAGYVWGIVILLLDMGRAALIILLADALLKDGFGVWVGLVLLIGNRYPVFHGFKGGKGVATYLGIAAALSPVFAALSCLTWVLVYSVARITFMASFMMIAVMGFGIMAHYHWHAAAVAGSVLSLALIYHAHRLNITNYLASREKGSADTKP